jgi:hypothetical protein
VHAYVYRWSVRPGNGIAVELLVTAPSVVVARRQVHRFLVDHDGDGWAVDGVSREMKRSPSVVPAVLPRRCPARA